MLTDCLFATDGVLLASTRPGTERAVREYQGTSSDFGLTVSNPKTRHMMTGKQVVDSDREPILLLLEERCILWMSFPILAP